MLRLSGKLGLRRKVRLFIGPGATAPMAFGSIRPAVLLPPVLIRDLSREEVTAVLAHELAHHRRFDAWVNWLQIAVAAIWWFNPLVWLLNRSIRGVREDCCDDLILHGQLTTQARYGEALIRLAEILSSNGPQARMMGYVQAMHPMRKRLIRVMDTDLPRRPRLSVTGCVVVVVLSGLLLPGIAMRAEELGPAEKPSGEPVATAEVAEEPATKPTVTLAGIVTDPDGKPLPGVQVRSYVSRWPDEPIFDGGQTVTDDGGRFRLDGVPGWDRLSRSASTNRMRGLASLLFEHPRFAIASFPTTWNDARSPYLDLKQIQIQLLEQTSFSGVVTDEQGQPVSDTVVRAIVRARRDRNGKLVHGELLYTPAWYQDPITTDGEGRFVIDKLPVFSTLGIRVEHPRYAFFDSENHPPTDKFSRSGYPYYAGDHDLHVKLSPGATVRGRLIQDGRPLRLEGVRVWVTDTTGSLRRLPWSLTDSEGQYCIAGLPDGHYAIQPGPELLNEAGLVGLRVGEFQAQASAVAREINLICTKGRMLSGRVVDCSSGCPLAGRVVGAHVLLEGSKAPGCRAETDENGRYRLLVLAGDCTVATPEWHDGMHRSAIKKVTVPAEGPVPEVDFAVAGQPEYPGRLVDEAGRPLVGTVVVAGTPMETSADGTFGIPEPLNPRGLNVQYYGHAVSCDGTLGVSFLWRPGDVEQPFEPVLRALATLRGRVVDRWGDPVADANASIRISMPRRTLFRNSGTFPPNPQDREMRADGTFEFRNLPVPQDAVFEIQFRWEQRFSATGAVVGRHTERRELADLKPGGILDLGDVPLGIPGETAKK